MTEWIKSHLDELGYFLINAKNKIRDRRKKDIKSKKSLDKKIDAINKLKSSLIQIPFDGKAAILSSDLYHKLEATGQKIDLFDCMIAGTIISNEYTKLITNNIKHFSRISELEVVSLA